MKDPNLENEAGQEVSGETRLFPPEAPPAPAGPTPGLPGPAPGVQGALPYGGGLAPQTPGTAPDTADAAAPETEGAPQADTDAAPEGGAQPPRAKFHWGLAAGSVIVVALLAAVVGGMLLLGAPAAAPHTEVPLPTATPAPPTPAPTPAPTPDPVLAAAAAVRGICTGQAPQMTDPAAWNEAGAALMAQLEADPYYQDFGFTADAAAMPALALETADALRSASAQKRPAWTRSSPEWKDRLEELEAAAAAEVPYPYLLAVNRAASTVTVYALDAAGRYTVPYMAMVCSGGEDTPTGFWSSPINYNWRLLTGPCYGQYATRIYTGYLFHSVPYYSQHKDDLEYDQFNELGTPASLGCIRLAVVDVKWVYDNCPLGTPVVIYDDAEHPGPMGKPGTIHTDPADEALRGWDPTDPDPANPWPAEYRTGTAIRSLAAWEEYNAAVADGRWDATLNETDLQGWSTDSSVEGTRG